MEGIEEDGFEELSWSGGNAVNTRGLLAHHDTRAAVPANREHLGGLAVVVAPGWKGEEEDRWL